jgi:hypothetical protein
MLCQLCLEKPAMCHLTTRSRAGHFIEDHYCSACYAAKYLQPPAAAASFPRPRFTLNNVMILLGLWTVPNAIAAWVFRSGYVTGTPAQIRQWTIQTFLGVNLLVGFSVLWTYLLTWLVRVMWYKKTGDLVPMPQQKMTLRQSLALIVALTLYFAWCKAAIVLDRWLTPMIWPIQRSSPHLLSVLLLLPGFLMLALRFPQNRYLRERIWQEWRAASRQERLLRALAIAWSLGFLPLLVFGGPSLMTVGFNLWFPIPAVLLIWVVGQMVLMAAVAFSVRRR